MSEFEESEFRGPLFNQLESGNHLLWEPGQVFERTIGIDRASFCLHEYLWNLHGHSRALGGSILNTRIFGHIWGGSRKNKHLPDFELNLFVQAKRSTYSSRSKATLRPHIIGKHWFFEITPHQQYALEQLEQELTGKALVIYAAPVFHKQQELYHHTQNQTIVSHSTFPKASSLKGHSKWFYNKPGIIGVANPDFEFINDEQPLMTQVESMRQQLGEYQQDRITENLLKLSSAIKSVVESQSNSFEATRFAYYSDLIDYRIDAYNLEGQKGLKDFMQLETFAYLWRLNWLTF